MQLLALNGLRQVVLHPALCPANFVQDVQDGTLTDSESDEDDEGAIASAADTNPPKIQRLLEHLENTPGDEKTVGTVLHGSCGA